jgi:hypothetical protein
MIREQDINALRSLASRWMEHANLPIMENRRRQWKAIKDLNAEKPMILVETCMLSDYIGVEELVCEDTYTRNIEKSLFEIVRHADEIGDDIVVDPYFRIPWAIEISDLGIPMLPVWMEAIWVTTSISGSSPTRTLISCTCAPIYWIEKKAIVEKCFWRTSLETSCPSVWAATPGSIQTPVTTPGLETFTVV